jgi:hypothetical protein
MIYGAFGSVSTGTSSGPSTNGVSSAAADWPPYRLGYRGANLRQAPTVVCYGLGGEASGCLVVPAVFNTDVVEQLDQAGSIPVRLRRPQET